MSDIALITQYQTWFHYEQDAHHKTLASFETVPVSQRDDPRFQKAVDLCAHLVAARALWLYRFGIAETGPTTPEDLFPQNISLDTIKAQTETMHTTWSAYLDALDSNELHRVFEYQSMEGPLYRNVVSDLLTQLFGHSWYHRGQIALLIRQLGGTPAETDYVFWSRQNVRF